MVVHFVLLFLSGFTKSSLKDALDLWVTDQSQALITYGPIESWDVGNVTDMSYLLCGWTWNSLQVSRGCRATMRQFNSDISNWDMSSVTNMMAMFHSADAFNQPLQQWDVSKVIDMRELFRHNDVFNQPLNSWNVSSVMEIRDIFDDTPALSDCNKASINQVFSASSVWGTTPFASSWSNLSPCQPPPSSPAPPYQPPPPPTTFYIRGSRSQIVFGTNDGCTLELASGATSLTSTCPINTPSSRRLEDASNESDRIAQLETRIAQLEVDKAQMKEQIQFLTTEVKMLKEQRKAP